MVSRADDDSGHEHRGEHDGERVEAREHGDAIPE
jgi:hypothetical protein